MDENLSQQIVTLKEKAAARGSLRYPPMIRQMALGLVDELRAQGLSQERVSQVLEIPWGTIRRWKKKRDGEKVGAGSGFRRVGMAAAARAADSPALVSPSGWRIEGLSLDELVEVAGRLS